MLDRTHIYQACTASEWREAVAHGVYRGSADDRRDGFIHFSNAAQLQETLRRHFAGQKALVVVTVDSRSLGDRLRWEASRGGDLFPHLYGDLDVALALEVRPIDPPE
jgi:uncharacterized protein (DUF952 family)